jgi:WG containing repeat
MTTLSTMLLFAQDSKPNFDYVYKYYEGVARVKLNNKFGYINRGGKEITAIKYDEAWDFSEGMAVVKLNNKSGYINRQGVEVIPLKYFGADPFFKGIAKVMYGSFETMKFTYGYINKSGKEVVPVKYEGAYLSQIDFVKVSLNKKWGLIDLEGNIVLAVIYEKIDNFSENGKAEVTLNGETFYVNKKGERVE